jgi:membrane protease YdiL (CAAX protease family)
MLLGAVLVLYQFIVVEGAVWPAMWGLGLDDNHCPNPFPSDPLLRWIGIIYASLSASILEELVFRGAVISLLERRIGSRTAILWLACLIFAGIHWCNGLGAVLLTFIWAIVPTIWFQQRREIWSLVVCHSLYDLVIFSEWL